MEEAIDKIFKVITFAELYEFSCKFNKERDVYDIKFTNKERDKFLTMTYDGINGIIIHPECLRKK